MCACVRVCVCACACVWWAARGVQHSEHGRGSAAGLGAEQALHTGAQARAATHARAAAQPRAGRARTHARTHPRLAEIDAAHELAHDEDVHALHELALERAAVSQLRACGWLCARACVCVGGGGWVVALLRVCGARSHVVLGACWLLVSRGSCCACVPAVAVTRPAPGAKRRQLCGTHRHTQTHTDTDTHTRARACASTPAGARWLAAGLQTR
jgi:hypothetical protein